MKTKLLTLFLCLIPTILSAQNYEKEGDELFAQAQYEAAYKKYAAFIAAVGETDAVKQKQTKCSKCKTLLAQAKIAEQEALNTNNVSKYEEASRLYNDLFDTHPLQVYKSKTNLMKQKADNIRDNIQREQQIERDRQAKEAKERQKKDQIDKSLYYINEGDNRYKYGDYKIAIESYNKAVEIQGEYVTESLKQKLNYAQKCCQLIKQAESAEIVNRYDIAARYYNDLYAIHSLQMYKNKVNELQQKVQKAEQRKQQQAEYEQKKQQEQTNRESAKLNIEKAKNTFTLQQLIEHPLGLADKDWDDYSKHFTLKALIKKYPDFKNSPKDDAKYKKSYENGYVVRYGGNDYIMNGHVTDVVVFAPLTFASLNYKDKENGAVINREVEVTYIYNCPSKIFAEELVTKLKSEAQIYGYLRSYQTSYNRRSSHTSSYYSTKYDNFSITQEDNIVKIYYVVRLNLKNPVY